MHTMLMLLVFRHTLSSTVIKDRNEKDKFPLFRRLCSKSWEVKVK
jgi:hypothetical protein